MATLQEFLLENCISHPRATSPGFVDIVFFDVECKATVDATQFRQMISAHKGVFNEVDIFDGAEHSYIELGGWLGDQTLALLFQALGTNLELWKLLTPKTVLGEHCTSEMERNLAGQGLISIIAERPLAK